jgi:hypothetical protein
VRAGDTEELLGAQWPRRDRALAQQAGELAAAAAAPIPAHLTTVLTRRALERAWS